MNGRVVLMILCLVTVLAMVAVSYFPRNTPDPLANLHHTTSFDSSELERANLGILQEKQHREGWEITYEPQQSRDLKSQHKPTPILCHPKGQGDKVKLSEGNFDKLIPGDKQRFENPGPAQGKPPVGILGEQSRRLIPPCKSWDSLQNPWVVPLRELVKKLNVDSQVGLLFSTYSYLNITLNWLIAAKVRCKPPVTNVIVVCYDMRTQNFLMEREIPSVFINPNTLLPGRKGKFTFATRLIVMMIVTFWGYDVVQYDADALILKNPRELFARHPDSDIVASAARGWPPAVVKKWGFVACMGVVLFRSTPKIELLWDIVKEKIEVGDDQKLVNEALDDFGIRWLQNGSIFEHSVDGVCENGLKATILSQKDICRNRCKAYSSKGNREFTPYIMHHVRSVHTGEAKKTDAIKMKVWWLTEDWNSAINHMKGTEWLASLMS